MAPARPVAWTGAVQFSDARGATPNRRPSVSRCSGGGRKGSWRCFASDGITGRGVGGLFRVKGRVGFVSPDAPDRAHRKSWLAQSQVRAARAWCAPDAIVPAGSSQGSLPAQCPGISSPESKTVPTMARSKRPRCVGEAQSDPVHLEIVPAADILYARYIAVLLQPRSHRKAINLGCAPEHFDHGSWGASTPCEEIKNAHLAIAAAAAMMPARHGATGQS